MAMRRINMQQFQLDVARYELRSGNEPDAPNCPYGNRFQWIGYDRQSAEYVRLTESVFKHLVRAKG